MKTTVEIPDALYARARRLAAGRGVPFRSVLASALRDYIKHAGGTAPAPFKLQRKPFHGHGLLPGIREGDWGQIRALIYEGRGG